MLSILAATSRSSIRQTASNHVALLLLLAFSVYAYRDLIPLCTFTLSPMDGGDGWRLWSRLAILTFAAVLVPLLAPREYVPIDPTVCHFFLTLQGADG